MTQSEFIVKMYEVLLLAIKNVQKMFFASEAHRLGFVDDAAYRKFIMDGWQSTERPPEKDLTQKAERGESFAEK